jgi:hypothetical protein
MISIYAGSVSVTKIVELTIAVPFGTKKGYGERFGIAAT